MPPPASPCPKPELWNRICRWDLVGADAERFARHLESCSDCSRRANSLAKPAFFTDVKGVPQTRDRVASAHLDEVIKRLWRLADTIGPGATCTWNPASGTRTPQAVPAQLGEYRLDELIGQGGMGSVYKATDVGTKRHAAVKVLNARRTSEEQKARFLREGRALASVSADQVVTIYRVGEEQGVPFLAMEHLQGNTLDKWALEQPNVPGCADVLWVAEQVLRGLVAVHAKNLVHRDLKPRNLWVQPNPKRIKILDFGLARFAATGDTITPHGYVVGTPAFMAPEQATGQPVDVRADLFSLGVVLYSLIDGLSPFERDTTSETLGAIAHFTPTPLPGLPAPVNAFIAKLLAKAPENRFSCAEEALAEVEALQRAHRPSTTVVVPIRESKKGFGWRVAALFLLAGIGVSGFFFIIFRDREGKPLLSVEVTARKPTDDPKATASTHAPNEKNADASTSAELRPGRIIQTVRQTLKLTDGLGTIAMPVFVFPRGHRGEVLEFSEDSKYALIRTSINGGTEDWWVAVADIGTSP